MSKCKSRGRKKLKDGPDHRHIIWIHKEPLNWSASCWDGNAFQWAKGLRWREAADELINRLGMKAGSYTFRDAI
jgi:hypothetical protein